MLWIIGDVHVCAREFDDLLRAIRFDPGKDVLWSAGDLVNTGPHSVETLRLWRDVGGAAVLGNHDIYAILSHAGIRPRHEDKLDALFAAPDGEPLLARLREQPVIVPIPRPGGARETWLVHAGLHPEWDHPRNAAPVLGGTPGDLSRLQREEVTFATRSGAAPPTAPAVKNKCTDIPWMHRLMPVKLLLLNENGISRDSILILDNLRRMIIPDFAKMIAHAQEQQFKAIIFHKLNHFSRNIENTLRYFRDLKSLRCIDRLSIRGF